MSDMMEKPVMAPSSYHLEGFDLSDPRTRRMVEQAEEADRQDHQLTIRQAIKKYKKAVFWAMFLSLS